MAEQRKQFVPITDELLYNNPELLSQLVPFNLEYPCLRWSKADRNDSGTLVKQRPVQGLGKH